MRLRTGLIIASKATLIAAALALVLLPAGQLPRYVGPCGKALCECPAQNDVHSHCSAGTSSKPVLTFGPTAYSSEAPGWDLQDVFTGVTLPQTVQIKAVEFGQLDGIEVFESATPPSHIAEISVPPPRA